MKINVTPGDHGADNRVLSRKQTARVQAGSVGRKEAVPADRGNRSEALVNNRALTEALSIAQISRGIIQKAIIASTRLKDVARKAVVNGQVNQDELTTALADINNSLSLYGDGAAPPVQTGFTNLHSGQGIPDIKNEFTELREIAFNLAGERYYDFKKIDQIQSSLHNKMKEAQQVEKNIIGMMGRDNTNVKEFTRGESRATTTRAAAEITAGPAAALSAQGNIMPLAVEQLT